MNLNKDEILKRENWNELKYNIFIKENYTINDVEKIETCNLFNKINCQEDYNKYKNKIINEISTNTLVAIKKYENNIPIRNEKLINEQDLNQDEIIKINYEKINKDDYFEVFTDGSFKEERGIKTVGLGGWIMNSKNEVVLEFVKKETRLNKKFEINSINYMFKLINKLGIKNFTLHSDSLGDIEKLTKIQYGMYLDEIYKKNNIESYNYILEGMGKNIKFTYIPREYNEYANELSKYYMNIQSNENLKELENNKKNGFIKTDKYQYFTNNKIVIKDTISNIKKINTIIFNGGNFYYLNIDNHYEIIKKISLKDFRLQYKEEIKKYNLRNIDDIIIVLIKEYYANNKDKEINLLIPSKGFDARIKNITTISPENNHLYYDLNDVFNQYSEINIYTNNHYDIINKEIKNYEINLNQRIKHGIHN